MKVEMEATEQYSVGIIFTLDLLHAIKYSNCSPHLNRLQFLTQPRKSLLKPELQNSWYGCYGFTKLLCLPGLDIYLSLLDSIDILVKI